MIFTKTEKTVGIKEIKKMEQFVGLEFPKEFRNHLLQNNGGQCKPNIFNFTENGKNTNSNIDWFLAIYDGEYDNLKLYIEIYKIEGRRMPSHILPIAHDSGGNLICISCGKKDNGSVYFWNHEKEVDYNISGDEDFSNLYLIANSFNEFLNLLK